MKNMIENVIFVGKKQPLDSAINGLRKSKYPAKVFIFEENVPGVPKLQNSADELNVQRYLNDKEKYDLLDTLEHEGFLEQLAGENTLILSASTRTIFDRKTIERFPYMFNFHHGDLRKLRGSNIHYWAIVNGEKEFVVTLHKIEEQLDAGKVIFEESFPLTEQDTAKTIYDRSNDAIASLGEKFFIKLAQQGIEGIIRDGYGVELGRNYLRKDRRVEQLEIDMDQPIADILREVRALYFPEYRNTIVIRRKNE